MTQSTFHVAIIMDGNGRWATERGLPRRAGHRAGAEAVRRTVEAAAKLEVDLVTLYAFSSDNWRRPQSEVEMLMKLFARFLREETRRCVEAGVQLNVIGRRDRLSEPLVALIDEAESATRGGKKLRLRIAIDYSARDAIARAAAIGRAGKDFRSVSGRAGEGARPPMTDFRECLTEAIHADQLVEDVDLLIRTGREKRLSDFLLFEAAYAELHFTDRLWPDFGEEDLACAVEEFRRRDRRFGTVHDEEERAACTT